MKSFNILCVALGATTLIGCQDAEVSRAAQEAGGTFAAERIKAQTHPYAEDSGPESVDVSGYPIDLQDAYRGIFLAKCQACHSAARTLYAPYVEPYGSRAGEAAKVERWKREQPELFSDPLIWKVEARREGAPGLWEVYINRMAAKPGVSLTDEEKLRLWDFLRYDSEKRKTGPNAAAWAAQRRKLLADFNASHPDRYRELYEKPG